MADAMPLDITSAESAQKAILELLIKYSNYPTDFTATNSNVKWGGTTTGQSIGLIPLQGAIYLKKYISGSYTAQLPFMIVYQSAPTTNKASIANDVLLENISKWLCECGIDFVDSRLKLEKIERISPVYPYNIDEKMQAVAVQMQLKYSFIKKN